MVREFLESRLAATFGSGAVIDLHRRAGDAAAASDWSLAAHHYHQAEDTAAVASVIESAMPEIMGTGQHSNAVELLAAVPMDSWPPGLGLMRSRMEMQEGEVAAAIASSEGVLSVVAAGTPESDYALLNLATIHLHAGNNASSRSVADELRSSTSSEDLRLIAEATIAIIDASATGSIAHVNRVLLRLAERQRGLQPHFYGVTMLNLAMNTHPRGRSRSRQSSMHKRPSTRFEKRPRRSSLSTALMAKASALTHLGQIPAASTRFRQALVLATRQRRSLSTQISRTAS